MTTNIETDLKEILNKIETKLDKLGDDVSQIKTQLAVVQSNQDNFKEKLSEINSTQRNQIWSLITILTGTLISITIAYFRAR